MQVRHQITHNNHITTKNHTWKQTTINKKSSAHNLKKYIMFQAVLTNRQSPAHDVHLKWPLSQYLIWIKCFWHPNSLCCVVCTTFGETKCSNVGTLLMNRWSLNMCIYCGILNIWFRRYQQPLKNMGVSGTTRYRPLICS